MEKNLLTPRYRVENPYPEMGRHNIEVGDILTDNSITAVTNQNGDAIFAFEWETFPNIFKPLSWWEERALEDMPEYVKSGQGNSVRKVKGYELHWNKIILDGGKVRSISQWFPATLTEYQSFINGNSNK